MAKKLVYLTRRQTFCASHRLHCEELSDEENRRLFDKCNLPNGHGHNYELFVTLRAEPDPVTGLLLNLVDLKVIILETVIDKVDHRYLNLDVPEFKTINPTVENMTLVIWDWLSPKLPTLFEVKLHETENNMAVYRG